MVPLAREAVHSPNADKSADIGNLRPIKPVRERLDSGALAEGVGFEPTIRFPVYTLSKRAP